MKTKTIKIIAVISGILSVIQLIYPFVMKNILKLIVSQNIEKSDTSAAIGIIGSSDGPTAIFISQGSNIIYPILKYGSIIIFVISMCFLIIRRK